MTLSLLLKNRKTLLYEHLFQSTTRADDPCAGGFALYENKELTPPPTYGKEFGTHLSAQANSSRAAECFYYWKNFNKSARNYYATLTGVDAAVGMIRETLKREGLT